MGTSISSSGPGKTPLLPDWYQPEVLNPIDDNENEEAQDQNERIKTRMILNLIIMIV